MVCYYFTVKFLSKLCMCLINNGPLLLFFSEAMLLVELLLWLGVAHAIYIPPGPKFPCPPQKQLLYPCKCTKGTDTGITVYCNSTNLASLSVALTNIASIQAPIDALTISSGKFCK